MLLALPVSPQSVDGSRAAALRSNGWKKQYAAVVHCLCDLVGFVNVPRKEVLCAAFILFVAFPIFYFVFFGIWSLFRFTPGGLSLLFFFRLEQWRRRDRSGFLWVLYAVES